MSFTFKDETGQEVEQVQEIYSCTECVYCSTKQHFHETGDGIVCPLCRSPVEKSGEQSQQSGMSDFQYRQVLNSLQENCTGVGTATIDSIGDTFVNGDDFTDSCKAAYDEQAYGELTHVSGIGESTARKICLQMADLKGWEDGMAESSFSIAKS